MSEKTRVIAVAAATALAVAVFATTAVHAFLYAPEAEAPAPGLQANAPLNKTANADRPDRLLIPALDINAAVLEVGITPGGKMAVPPNFTDVGWYKYGTVPGTKGSAVIAGHVDNGVGLDGVFKHVSELKVGDDLYIITRGDARVHFVVSEIAVYPYDAVPTDLLFNRADEVRLNLITCDGTWIKGAKTYDHRLVVYAIRSD